MELNPAGVAVIISIIAIMWSVLSSRNQRQNAALVANHTSIVNVESTIRKLPQVLRFHGVEDPEHELKQHGVTAEEFAYLLCSFTLDGTYYRIAPEPRAILKEGSYRHSMCRASGTRRAWPLLRRLITNSAYRDHLDELFGDLDQKFPLDMAAQQADAADDTSRRS